MEAETLAAEARAEAREKAEAKALAEAKAALEARASALLEKSSRAVVGWPELPTRPLPRWGQASRQAAREDEGDMYASLGEETDVSNLIPH